jgi:hypothetical protein
MTTSIITNLLGSMCELFYKYKKSLEIENANINTLRNYGFSTSFSLNYGFELYQPFDLNDIKIQPGVFTYNSVYQVLPNLNNDTTIQVQNLISLQDLPASGLSTINYVNKTLPLKISIQQNGASIVGIASNFKTYGVPYDSNEDLDANIIRDFESDLINDPNLSILVLTRLEDVTISGINTNWQSLPTSLYSISLKSFRYNNGYGQFYSLNANDAFIKFNTQVDYTIYNNLFNSTYMNVYNWANLLSWNPDFISWYNLNKSEVPFFVQEFLNDYFGVS